MNNPRLCDIDNTLTREALAVLAREDQTLVVDNCEYVTVCYGVEETLSELGQTHLDHVRSQKTGHSILFVWGNDPGEMIADYSNSLPLAQVMDKVDAVLDD